MSASPIDMLSPGIDQPSARQSGRVRCAPLEFWAGERPVYHASPSGLSLAGIIRSRAADRPVAATKSHTPVPKVAAKDVPTTPAVYKSEDMFNFDEDAAPPRPPRPSKPQAASKVVVHSAVAMNSAEIRPRAFSPLGAAAELISSAVDRAAAEAKAAAELAAEAAAHAKAEVAAEAKAKAAVDAKAAAVAKVKAAAEAKTKAKAAAEAKTKAVASAAAKAEVAAKAKAEAAAATRAAAAAAEAEAKVTPAVIENVATHPFASLKAGKVGSASWASQLLIAAPKSTAPLFRFASADFDDSAPPPSLKRPAAATTAAETEAAPPPTALAPAPAPMARLEVKKPKSRSLVGAMQTSSASAAPPRDVFDFDDFDDDASLGRRASLPPSKRLRKSL